MQVLWHDYYFAKIFYELLLGDISTFDLLAMIIAITAGTMFLMWIGELISEKKIGNGISLLIFAGIVSSLPQAVTTMLL